MATKVQKKVLWWMIDNGGELYITTGNKRVLFAFTDALGRPNEMFCKGNENLVGGLLAKKYAARMFEYTEAHGTTTHEVNGVVISVDEGEPLTRAQKLLRYRFKITEAGIRAAGNERPDPEEHSNVPHRNCTYKTRP